MENTVCIDTDILADLLRKKENAIKKSMHHHDLKAMV